MSLFGFFKRGLEKTKTAIVHSIQSVFTETAVWDDAAYGRLEKALLATDLGPAVTAELIADLRDRYSRGLISTGTDIIAACKEKIAACNESQRKKLRCEFWGFWEFLGIGS